MLKYVSLYCCRSVLRDFSMSYTITIFTIFFMVVSLFSLLVAFLAWQRRHAKGAKELALMMVAAGSWTFWLIFETSAATISDKVFWSGLEYMGAVSAPVFYLIFVLRFTGKGKYMVSTVLRNFISNAINLYIPVGE